MAEAVARSTGDVAVSQAGTWNEYALNGYRMSVSCAGSMPVEPTITVAVLTAAAPC